MKLAHILVCHTTDPTRAIESIPHSSEDLWFVFLHSDNALIRSAVTRLMKPRCGEIFDYRENRGLAKSWNEGIHLAIADGCDAVLLLNDDLYFFEEGYKKFRHTIEAINNVVDKISFVTVNGVEGGTGENADKVVNQSFACCAITRRCIDIVGYFDENFTPAYYEDLDYNHRATISGFHSHLDERVLVRHERSSTMQLLSQQDRIIIHNAVIENRNYFFQKWGDEMTYTNPFNSEQLSAAIPYERCSDPYPGNQPSRDLTAVETDIVAGT